MVSHGDIDNNNNRDDDDDDDDDGENISFYSSSSLFTSIDMPDSTPAAQQPENPLNPRNLKPCCACPVTKTARDDCFIKFSSDQAAVKCADLIEQHKACMRGYGFKI